MSIRIGSSSGYLIHVSQLIINLELVACHDRVKKGATRLAREFGCEPYTDYKAFLKHPGLDVVTIAKRARLDVDASRGIVFWKL